MKNKQFRRPFKVGDKVRCAMFGVGEVLSIDSHESTPVVVKIEREGVKRRYTLSGIWYSEYKYPVLFHLDEYPAEMAALQESPMIQEPEPGQWCLFWDGPTIISKALSKFKEMYGCFYVSNAGSHWNYCQPLTDEQVKSLNLEP